MILQENGIVQRHPCFQQGAPAKYGRIHLPVSPGCNIQCRFCRRCFNKVEDRPGVTRQILTPEKAVGVVERALKLCPEITVVGIAGPGETLTTPHAEMTFQRVHARYPDLILCMSTNGLLLEEKAEALIEAGVRTITVTINAARLETFDQVYAGILYKGWHLSGSEAGEVFLPLQYAGIRRAVSLGATVKINTVLIPGVNEEEIGQIAEEAARAGATRINIIPLIPQQEMAEFSPPDCHTLNRARQEAERFLPVFRHCQHCRADACGIPGIGKEFSGELYDRPMETFSHG